MVQKSEMLKNKALASDILILVNAFHSYAHNHACELVNHPLYLKGCGLEDFEVMEHVFSSFNAVTSTICHVSKCHLMQLLDLHFQQWDKDKYVELSMSFQ